MFFTCEAVAGKAKVLWDEVETNAQKVDALRWKVKEAGRAVIEELDMPSPPSNALEQQYESLEKLLEAVQPLADTPSSGAHFRLLVTPNKQGWAKCVRATSVARGDIFVSCGSGSRMDAEQAERKMPDQSGFLCKVAEDNTLVAYVPKRNINADNIVQSARPDHIGRASKGRAQLPSASPQIWQPGIGQV